MEIHLGNRGTIEDILGILREKDIDINTIINIVNVLADFIQYNSQYECIKSFNVLADLIVSIIEEFNTEDIDGHIDVMNIADELKNSLYELKRNIIDVKINIYFYGKDKYNILNKSLSKDINIINNIEDYINLYIKSHDLQIDILILSEETVNDDLDFSLYFNNIIYYDKLMNYIL